MAQEDYTVTDQNGASHLAELNLIMAAIASNNSGATAPSVTYAHMWWVDTTSGWVKQRNAANSAWEKKFPIDKARVDVASAATLDLDANAVTSDYLRITGTTTVTAVTLAAGQRRIAVAGGAFKLTNSANLIVQGGADYTTTAGDLLLFLGESGGVVRVAVFKADGTAVVSSSVPTVTAWTAFTPTYSGFGTVSSSSMFSRRVGDSLEIQGTFVLGTTTTAEARMTIGTGLTIDSTKVPSLRHCGSVVRSTGVAAQYAPLMSGGNGYITFSINSASSDGLISRLGVDIGASGNTLSINALIPITGW
jgi:hypothetical protein